MTQEKQIMKYELDNLGFDARYIKEYSNSKYLSFMKRLEKEVKTEAKTYIDYIEDCEDDYYLRLKNFELKRNK